jgi:glyoxylase-like metal-dependent hydrolase (beta-lactamase superfamily II)
MPMKSPLLQLEIGPYRITVFNMGYLALDGGAMFGVVPRTLWSRLTEPDAQNRINLATNCLLIETGAEKIMLDAGCGTKFSEKYREIYGIRQEEGEDPYDTPVDRALASVGLKSGDITQIIFTHLHFDHAGGATRPLADGTVAPTFENAQYVIHQGEWEYGICPHERCKASYLKENLEPVLQSGQLKLLTGERNEIAPGLWQEITGGHTPNHQALILDLPEGGFIFWGDLIPTRHHLKIPYVMGYDEYPLQTMEAKRRLLKRAYEKNWISLFEHDPDMPACRLQATGKPDDYTALPLAAAPIPSERESIQAT